MNLIKSATIYKIETINGLKCYIGSTTVSTKSRYSKHKWVYKNRNKNVFLKSQSANAVFCEENTLFELEHFKNISKNDLLKKEREYILKNKHSVNKNLPLGKSTKKNREAYLKYFTEYNKKRKNVK